MQAVLMRKISQPTTASFSVSIMFVSSSSLYLFDFNFVYFGLLKTHYSIFVWPIVWKKYLKIDEKGHFCCDIMDTTRVITIAL